MIISPTNTQSASSSSGPEEKQQEDTNQKYKILFLFDSINQQNAIEWLAIATSTTFFFEIHVSVCTCQGFLSVPEMPEISVCTQMPEIQSWTPCPHQRLGRHALNRHHPRQRPLHPTQMSLHAFWPTTLHCQSWIEKP